MRAGRIGPTGGSPLEHELLVHVAREPDTAITHDLYPEMRLAVGAGHVLITMIPLPGRHQPHDRFLPEGVAAMLVLVYSVGVMVHATYLK